MNELPPPNEGLEDVDERYRRLSDRDSSRPSEAIRRAVLQHAAELAAQARPQASSAPLEFRRAAANKPRWRVATYGGLAAAALAGLLIAPHFMTPSTAPIARLSPSPAPAPERAAEKPSTPAEPRAFAGNVRPSQNPSLGAVADARRAPTAQSPARESASTPQLAQTQSMRAPFAARAMPSSPPSAAPPSAAPTLAAPSAADATALRDAAQSGNTQGLQALLAGRIDIDARDSNGRTALMLAVLHDQKEAVNSLLAAGADPNAADTSGTTPLEAAMAGARSEIAAALRQAGAR